MPAFLAYVSLGLSLLMLALCVPLALGRLDMLRSKWLVSAATATALVVAANFVAVVPWQVAALLLPPYGLALAMFYWSHFRLRRLEHEHIAHRQLIATLDREIAAGKQPIQTLGNHQGATKKWKR